MQDEAANFPDPVDVQPRKKSSASNCVTAIASVSDQKDREDAEKSGRRRFRLLQSCGVEIGIRRLEARPTADLASTAKRWLKFAKNKWLANYSVPSRLPQAGNAPALFFVQRVTDTHYIGRFAPSPSGELHFVL